MMVRKLMVGGQISTWLGQSLRVLNEISPRLSYLRAQDQVGVPRCVDLMLNALMSLYTHGRHAEGMCSRTAVCVACLGAA